MGRNPEVGMTVMNGPVVLSIGSADLSVARLPAIETEHLVAETTFAEMFASDGAEFSILRAPEGGSERAIVTAHLPKDGRVEASDEEQGIDRVSSDQSVDLARTRPEQRALEGQTLDSKPERPAQLPLANPMEQLLRTPETRSRPDGLVDADLFAQKHDTPSWPVASLPETAAYKATAARIYPQGPTEMFTPQPVPASLEISRNDISLPSQPQHIEPKAVFMAATAVLSDDPKTSYNFAQISGKGILSPVSGDVQERAEPIGLKEASVPNHKPQDAPNVLVGRPEALSASQISPPRLGEAKGATEKPTLSILASTDDRGAGLSPTPPSQKELPSAYQPVRLSEGTPRPVLSQTSSIPEISTEAPTQEKRLEAHAPEAKQAVSQPVGSATQMTLPQSNSFTGPMVATLGENPMPEVERLQFVAMSQYGPSELEQIASQSQPKFSGPLNEGKAVLIFREALDGMAANKQREIELQLHPKDLGRLRFVMSPSEGQIMVQVFADRPETLDAMRRHVDLLAKEFLSEGFGAADFSFEQDKSGGQTQFNNSASKNVFVGADEEPDRSSRYEWHNPDARLDMRI